MLCYAKSLQSCPTLCDPIDGSLPGSSAHGFSRQEYWSGVPLPSPSSVTSGVQLFVTPQTVARQAPLSMAVSRQEYWSGLPFSSLEDLPDPGIEPMYLAFQADSLLSELQGISPYYYCCITNFPQTRGLKQRFMMVWWVKKSRMA